MFKREWRNQRNQTDLYTGCPQAFGSAKAVMNNIRLISYQQSYFIAEILL